MVDSPMSDTSGRYVDGSGDPLNTDEVREMLWVHVLAGWDGQYQSIDVTLHRDGGATVHLELADEHVRGMAEVW